MINKYSSLPFPQSFASWRTKLIQVQLVHPMLICVLSQAALPPSLCRSPRWPAPTTSLSRHVGPLGAKAGGAELSAGAVLRLQPCTVQGESLAKSLALTNQPLKCFVCLCEPEAPQVHHAVAEQLFR